MTRTILITGGTGDIGVALVREFAQNGDQVFFQYKSKYDEAKKLSDATGAIGIQLDFSKNFEPPDLDVSVLINNAGINKPCAPVADVLFSDWEDTLWVNLMVPLKLSLAYIPRMLEKEYGRIINISSIYGLRGSENNGPYNVSKHGMSGLTKSIAWDYGHCGITANEICPGPVDSSLLASVASSTGKQTPEEIDKYFKDLADEIPLKKLASPKDIANCAKFLASTPAAYINGISMPVDGGLIA